MRRIGLIRLVSAALIVSCKPGVLPGWDEGSAEPVAQVQPDSTDDSDAAHVEDPPETASAPTPVAQGDHKREAPSDTAGDGGEAATSAPPDTAGPGPLPKPLHTKVDPSCGNDPGVGQRLKGFKLNTPAGKVTTSGSHKGRVLLVNFWGTWCKPCLKELPEFDRLYRRYRKHGLTLVAVATDEEPEAVREFVSRQKLAAKVLIGGESYAGQYGSDKFPFSFVVDTNGVIKASYRGYKPECSGKLEADLRAELEKRNR